MPFIVAKALAACVLAYLFSPIDLIPDFIPVVGYLDDLILVPAGLPRDQTDTLRSDGRTSEGRPHCGIGAKAQLGCSWSHRASLGSFVSDFYPPSCISPQIGCRD